jgi:hypothetical protein
MFCHFFLNNVVFLTRGKNYCKSTKSILLYSHCKMHPYVAAPSHLCFSKLDWRRGSLGRKGVIKLDCGEREGLLIPENIHRGKLEEYARVSTI